MDELLEAIDAEALLPKKSASDGQEAEGRSLKDLMDWHKYKANQQAQALSPRKSAWARLSKAVAVTPGTEPR